MTPRATFTERAALMRSAKQRDSLTDLQVAQRFQCSVSTVHNLMNLLELAPELQAAVDAGAFPIRQAIRLAHKRTHEEQRQILRDLQAAEALRGPRLENSITAVLAGRPERLGRDTRRMLPRPFLEKWLHVLEQEPGSYDAMTRTVLRFILGKSAPPPVLEASLLKAGYKLRQRT